MAVVAVVAEVAVEAFPLNVAVIVPALKLPEASLATIVEAVFAFVAFDVTVKVTLLAWLAVNVCDPESPVPATASVKVPLFGVLTATHEGAEAPFDCNTYPAVPTDRKSTRLNSSHVSESRMPSSA